MLRWGGVGHVLTFMWTCRWRTCYRWLPAGACIHGWGGVGHVLTFMWTCILLRYCKFSWTLHSYVMLRYCDFSWTLHSYVMPRYCKFSWTLHSYVMLRAWKAAAERRGIPVQSVVHQVKNFTSEGPKMFRVYPTLPGPKRLTGPGILWRTSCQLTWFWSTKSVDIPLCTPQWHNVCSCGAGVLAWKVQILKGSWKNWKRCSDQKTAKNMWGRSFWVGKKLKNASFV